MQIDTKYFGLIEIQEKDIIEFKEGIPGFLNLHKYALMHDASCFNFLQSLDSKDVCFVVISPAVIMENYDILISEDTVNKLEIKKPEHVAVFAIINIHEDMKDITANLKAPIIINASNRTGRQEILDDSKYDVRYKITKEADASC
ncbi:MAG: flagellar assembly protein FliW [Clostridia bacterium]